MTNPQRAGLKTERIILTHNSMPQYAGPIRKGESCAAACPVAVI